MMKIERLGIRCDVLLLKPGDMVKIRSDHTVNGGAIGIVSEKWRDCWVVEWLTGEWTGFKYTIHPRFMVKYLWRVVAN